MVQLLEVVVELELLLQVVLSSVACLLAQLAQVEAPKLVVDCRMLKMMLVSAVVLHEVV